METEVYGAGSMHLDLAATRFNVALILLEKKDPRAKRLFEQAGAGVLCVFFPFVWACM